ncbi:MAG: hypothetical protein AAFQ95_23710 [Cyanobacteria bacterium J06621_3]
MTTGFIDNDILLKLVAFQLFEDGIATLGLAPDSLRVLPAARFMLLSRLNRQEYPQETLEKAITFLSNCQTIPTRQLPSDKDIPSEYKQLAPFRQIDPGEADLIVATANTTDFLLLSGDKRCFKALPAIPSPIYARLQGKAICLEQIILKLIDVLGFEEVCARIKPAVHQDKAIYLCFGYSRSAPESQVREALQSCINEINIAAPGLLVKLP